MKCIICGSKNIRMIDTVISDFVMARIDPTFETHKQNIKTKLCFCEDCSFAFYQYRLSGEEEELLYKNYRDAEYQKTREKYECWYSKRVNDSLNHGKGLKAQRTRIKKLLFVNSIENLRFVLDYGGNEGATFYDELGTEGKYVYDISGVKTIPGVTAINTFEGILCHHYDLIMCNMVFEHLSNPYELLDKLNRIGDFNTKYYIEVPSENPFISGNKFSIINNVSLLVNPDYNWIRLVKYYFQQKRQPFMPMKEHVNFFTKGSLAKMLEIGGFSVIGIQETFANNSRVLSVLFSKTRL